jgi:hypothetical protein
MTLEYTTRTIPTKYGILQNCVFQVIDPGHTLVLVRGAKGMCPTGATLCRHGSKWHVFMGGLFDADRGSLHQQQSFSAVNDGELEQLFTGCAQTRDWVSHVLNPAIISGRGSFDCRRAFGAVVSGLGRANHPEKRRAFFDLLRGLKEIDSLGRKNPPAAAMATGAGLGWLMKRQKNVTRMLGYMNTHSFRIHLAISEIDETFANLFDYLGGLRESRKPHFRPRIWEVVRQPSEPTRMLALATLADQVETFKHVHALPYRKMAFHLRKELTEAYDLAASPTLLTSHEEMDLLRTTLVRMRQGVGWAFVLHFLEMEIRTPLSMLFGEVGLGVRAYRKAVNDFDRTEIVVDDEGTPEQFALVTKRIGDFKRRVRRCPDEALFHQIKGGDGGMVRRLKEVEGLIAHNSWTEAKEHLKEIAEML